MAFRVYTIHSKKDILWSWKIVSVKEVKHPPQSRHIAALNMVSGEHRPYEMCALTEQAGFGPERVDDTQASSDFENGMCLS